MAKGLILFVAVLAAVFCFSSRCRAECGKKDGPGGGENITFYDLQFSIAENRPDRGCLLRVSKQGREIFVGECAARVHEPKVFSDLPSANCQSLLAYCFSGGAHCCMLLVVATRCAARTALDVIDLAHSDARVKFVDADGSGRKEIGVVDWQFAYYGMEGSDLQLSFADSPAMSRLLVFDGGKWRPDRAGEFGRFYEGLYRQSSREARSASLGRKDSERVAGKAIAAAYYSVMSGKSAAEAAEVLLRLLPGSWKSESGKIIRDISRAVSEFDPVETIE